MGSFSFGKSHASWYSFTSFYTTNLTQRRPAPPLRQFIRIMRLIRSSLRLFRTFDFTFLDKAFFLGTDALEEH